jgi:hypothetical protein
MVTPISSGQSSRANLLGHCRFAILGRASMGTKCAPSNREAGVVTQNAGTPERRTRTRSALTSAATRSCRLSGGLTRPQSLADEEQTANIEHIENKLSDVKARAALELCARID